MNDQPIKEVKHKLALEAAKQQHPMGLPREQNIIYQDGYYRGLLAALTGKHPLVKAATA